MRVLHLITTLSVGGAEQMLVKLLRALDQRAFEPTVVTLVDEGPLIEVIRSMGIRVETLGLQRGAISVRGLARLTRIISHTKPDLIQSWMYHANLAASLARPWTPRKTPIIWNIRQSLYELSRERLLTRAVVHSGKYFAPHVDAIINNAHSSQQQHAAIGYRNARNVVIPNGFEIDRFRPDPTARVSVRREIGIPEDAVVIGMAARMHPLKDHANFLRASKTALLADPRLHFVLVGRDTDTHALVLDAASNGLRGRLHLLGERADMPRVLNAFDVLVSASRGEGCPNVVGEAMSCGVRVVGTNVGDTANVIGNCGEVVAPENSTLLADAMLSVAGQPSAIGFTMSDAARERIRTHYSIETIAKQYTDLWEGAIAQRGGKPPTRDSASPLPETRQVMHAR